MSDIVDDEVEFVYVLENTSYYPRLEGVYDSYAAAEHALKVIIAANIAPDLTDYDIRQVQVQSLPDDASHIIEDRERRRVNSEARRHKELMDKAAHACEDIPGLTPVCQHLDRDAKESAMRKYQTERDAICKAVHEACRDAGIYDVSIAQEVVNSKMGDVAKPLYVEDSA